jgi:tetratricopeptide (TPR) repeat protein
MCNRRIRTPAPGYARVAVAVLALAVASVAASARASEVDEAKRHYLKGTKAYEVGAYEEAIVEYREAYRLVDDPALLFNLGQAQRLAGHTVEALRAYRMFLLKVPDAPNRADVEAIVHDLERLPQPAAQKAVSTPVPPAPPIATAAAPAVATPPPASITTAPREQAPNAPSRTRVIAGAVVAGIGGALLAGGIAFSVLANHASNDVTHAAQTGGAFDYGIYSSGKTDDALGIALLSVGGCAVVVGAIVMIVAKRHQRAVVMRSLAVAD